MTKYRLWLPNGPSVIPANYEKDVPAWIFSSQQEIYLPKDGIWTIFIIYLSDKDMFAYFCKAQGDNWSAWLPMEVDE